LTVIARLDRAIQYPPHFDIPGVTGRTPPPEAGHDRLRFFLFADIS
jgi:hypothetical protein